MLRPTQTCFDDALDFISEVMWLLKGQLRSNDGEVREYLERFVVVHGICLTPDGQPYAHAWVEEMDVRVWQGALLNGARIFHPQNRTTFYVERRVQESTRYSVAEAARENERTDHFGPWVEKYRALCGNRPQKVPIEPT